MQVTIFPNATTTTVERYATFEDVYHEMLSMENTVSSLSGKEYDNAKRRLKCFCVGKFPNREAGARPESLEQALVFDLDHIPDPKSFADEHLKWSWIAFPSPSNKGIRLICKAEFGNEEERERLYFESARTIAASTGLKMEEDVPKELRKSTPIINTSTRNIDRLWFYTGVSWFHGNKESRPLVLSDTYVPVKRQAPVQSMEKASMTDVEALVSELERRKVDITADYESWKSIGLGMANDLGEEGRGSWHRICAINGTYDFKENERKYDNFLKTNKGLITLATLFKFAKDAGVVVEVSRKHERQFSEEKFNDRDAERMLVLYLSRHSDNFPEILHRVPDISADCFRHSGNRGTFQAIKFMSDKGEFIDPVTVWARVENFMEEDVRSYTEPISLEQATGYARVVHQLYRKSETVRILTEAAEAVAKGADVDSTIASVQSGGPMEAEDDSIGAAVAESSEMFTNALKKMLAGDKSLPGRATGFLEYDHMMGGRQDGKLNVIAGRPGMGKSTQALCEAYNMAKYGSKVGFVTLEMPRSELTARLSCMISGLSSEKRTNPNKLNIEDGEAEMFMEADRMILELLLFISEKTEFGAIVSQIRRWAAKGVKDIYIDYLGLITYDGKKGQSDASRIGDMTRILKGLAKELRISINLLVQLNRDVEKRPNRRPMLSDLRDSGSIEQDADTVTLPFRPEYYGITEVDGYSTVGYVELIVAKHRGGPCGSVWIGADMPTFRFFSTSSRPFVPKSSNRPMPSIPEYEEEEEGFEFPSFEQKSLF